MTKVPGDSPEPGVMFRLLLVTSSEDVRDGVLESLLSRKLLGDSLWLESADSLGDSLSHLVSHEFDMVLLDLAELEDSSDTVRVLRSSTEAVLVLLSDEEPADLYETLLGEGMADGYSNSSGLSSTGWGIHLLEMYDHALQNKRVESLTPYESRLERVSERQVEQRVEQQMLLLRADKLCKR